MHYHHHVVGSCTVTKFLCCNAGTRGFSWSGFTLDTWKVHGLEHYWHGIVDLLDCGPLNLGANFWNSTQRGMFCLESQTFWPSWWEQVATSRSDSHWSPCKVQKKLRFFRVSIRGCRREQLLVVSRSSWDGVMWQPLSEPQSWNSAAMNDVTDDLSSSIQLYTPEWMVERSQS